MMVWIPKNEGIMGYTQVALEDQLLEMSPEIRKHGMLPRLSFHESKNARMVNLVNGVMK